MSNLALYRKYRSQDFDEVVGQNHIVGAIKNAIKNGKHSHAYLLTGPRGVGKTTIARLIAKDINKLPKTAKLSDYLDIIEIDGASNRGIDEIRNLKEKIQVSPAKLEYKVYIIDEVHMLTKEAFNALLKTLEEPPAHAIFIFATTEIHKVPDTIISRTQRFDFRPIDEADIVGHLQFIASQEKISIDKPALELIAKLSGGGFRDAISLLDQVSATGGNITASTVTEFTGLQDTAKISGIAELYCAGKTEETIEKLNALYGQGADPALLAQQLLDFIAEAVSKNKAEYPVSSLIKLAEDLSWVQSNLRTTTSPKLVLQVGLVRSIIPQATPASPPKAQEPVKSPQKSSSPTNHAPAPATPVASKKPLKTESDDEKLIKSLSVIKHYNNSLYALLRGASLQVSDDQVMVSCRFGFHKDRISEQRNRQLIEKAFSKVYDRPMRLRATVEKAEVKNEINSDEELVSSAMAILGGEMVDG